MLFSTPMVQALLDKRKTQTRRIMKPQIKDCDHSRFTEAEWKDQPIQWSEAALKAGRAYCGVCGNGIEHSKDYSGIKCPYGVPDDLIWVRETWGVGSRPDPFVGSVDGFEYKADEMFIDEVESLPIYPCEAFDFGNYDKKGWRPSIHMPKIAARIWLQVTSVKVERLQDITEEDAQAEGVEKLGEGAFPWKHYASNTARCADAKTSFDSLWREINGDESWEANHWVWCVSFKVLSTTGHP